MVPRKKKLKLTTARFTQRTRIEEIETKIPLITSELNTMKYNRKVIGWSNPQTDNRKIQG